MHWGLILPGVCFELSVICTCVSVRRRDRCTCTALIRFAFLVLFCCTPLLLSVLISSCLTQVLRTLPFNCFVCAVLLLFVCPVLFCLCCCGARVIVLSLCSCGLAVSLGYCGPRCACAGPGVFRVVCPPLLWFLSLSFLPPLPREWSICALVQLAPRCAGASLWVSGCSCDGSVALLSCWECGLALLSFRHSVHGNKGY